MKPFLKWAGGKSRLITGILAAFPAASTGHTRGCGTYYEPFLGAGAVFFARADSLEDFDHAVLSDACAPLMHCHQMVRDQIDDVLTELDKMPADENWKHQYYMIRTAFNNTSMTNGPLAAARFIWLNKAGFNGMWRVNQKGEFNIPMGSYKVPALPPEEILRKASRLLQQAELLTRSFDEVMFGAGEGDQIYCDPPYVPLTATSDFTGYTEGGFGHRDQVLLVQCAQAAVYRKADVVLSNHDLPIVRELYAGFDLVEVSVRRSISADGKKRKYVDELLIRNGA